MSQKSQADLFIRGGQTTQHWLRMAAQVFRGATLAGATVFFITYVLLCLNYYEVPKVQMTWAHWLATFFVENRGVPGREIRLPDFNGVWVQRTAQDIYLDPVISDLALAYQVMATRLAWVAAIPTTAAYLLACIIFYIAGRRLDGDEHVRGTYLVSAKDLKRWSKRKWRAYEKRFGADFKTAPRYTIAGIEFPPNAVEAQTAISGTVGTGKSNAIKELLAGVRAHKGRAIIYDRMGALIREFYDPERDIIINPFDARSQSWSPFNEAERPEIFTQMAEVLIPDRQGISDPFWSQSARLVFDYAARELLKKGQTTNAALRQAILNIPTDDLAFLLEQTPGRHVLNKDIAKTAGSIRANLVAELRFLEFLRDDGEQFSIRDWVKNGQDGFIFLSGDAERAAATRNIISTLFEVAANALMTCPESHDPRVWFFMDEVPTLNRMPFLPKSLAEIRQFGGAFVVGYQVYSQLEDTYGDKAAQTIAGNLNNRIVLNTPDADTAERFSKSLGSEDVEERRESLTVGAHEARDGVGFSQQRVERRIVTASQIQSLPQFEGYIRFAYDAPTAFVTFDPYKPSDPQRELAPGFVPYTGNGMAVGSMDEAAAMAALANGEVPERTPFAALTDSDQEAAFQAWLRRMRDDGIERAADPDLEDELRAHYTAMRMNGRNPADIRMPAPPQDMSGHWGELIRPPVANVTDLPPDDAPPSHGALFDYAAARHSDVDETISITPEAAADASATAPLTPGKRSQPVEGSLSDRALRGVVPPSVRRVEPPLQCQPKPSGPSSSNILSGRSDQ